MEAIKKIIKAKGNKVTVDIPDEFINKNIEIILIPSEENNEQEKEDYLKTLQNGPKLSNQEIDNIEEISEEINQWKIEKY